MKKSLFRFAVLLLAAVFLMTTIACEQPGTPEVPPSSEESIWDIQSFDDLFKFATGAYTVDPENLPPLGEEDMSVKPQERYSWQTLPNLLQATENVLCSRSTGKMVSMER